MNLSNFFDDIESIEAANLDAECYYAVVITIYNEAIPVTFWRDAFRLEEFTSNNFISAVKEPVIKGLLKTGALSQEFFSRVKNHKQKSKRTVFIINSPFSSVKTKGLFKLFVNVAKIQKEDCVVNLSSKYELYRL